MNSNFDHKWLIKLAPLNDEIFSSWLTRLAMTYGCNSLDITWALWGEWRAWMTDIDRAVDDQRLNAIVETGIVEKNKLLETFLKPPAKKISFTTGKAIWPWILSIGSRNRKRLGGIQYCPKCLVESAYYRISWRFAWHTCCDEHSLRLSQNCPNCLSAIEYHRLTAEDKHLYLCASCKFDLRKTQIMPVTSSEVEVQNVFNDVLDKGFGVYGSLKLAAPDWFKLFMFYVRFIQKCKDERLKSLRKLALNLGIDDYHQSSTGLPLEMLGVEDRALMLIQSYPLMIAGPQQFKQQLKSCDVSLEACMSIMDPLPDKIRNMFTTNVTEKPYCLGLKTKYLPSSKRSVLKAYRLLMRGIRRND